MNNYKIAFVGWNPFQYIHIKKLAAAIPGSVFIIEKKKNNNIEEFTEEMYADTSVPLIIWEQKDMIKMDGLFDLIIAQTKFMHIHMFTKTPIIMIQYGYAKETHNYGTWRALSKLTLTFGKYAEKKISNFCPAVSVGNPRYDSWHEDSFHNSAKKKYSHLLNPNKKTILYMPTWGELSSVDMYLESILDLSDKYNVLLKLHHNTAILEKGRVNKKSSKDLYYFGATDDALDLMSLSDIVISDYSGAIFDAIYCDKPLLLLDLPQSQLDEIPKIDKYSLEIKERDKLGKCIKDPSTIIDSLNYIEKNRNKIIAKSKIIKKELFHPTKNSTILAVNTIKNFLEGRYTANQIQEYIRETVLELHTIKRSYAILKKKKS